MSNRLLFRRARCYQLSVSFGSNFSIILMGIRSLASLFD